jgi:hypothetical membrane protein
MCGIVGPIIYAIVVSFLGLLWPGYNPITQYMSELGAVDAPHALIMNVLGFQLLGIFMILYGFGLYHGISKGWNSEIGVALILVAGASFVAVGFFPCDPGCVNVTPTGIGHVVTTMIHAITMPFGILAISLHLKKDSHWHSYWRFSLAIVVSTIFLSPLPMLQFFDPWAGLLQRLGMALPLLWIEVMAIRLWRLSNPSGT